MIDFEKTKAEAEAFEEFVKSHPIPRPDDKDELPFK